MAGDQRCACARALALTVMVLLPASIAWAWLIGPALFVAGGAISGVYTLGVIQIGQDFRGQRLAVVSTGFAMAYAVGSVVGSTPMGLAIDLFGPRALPILIAGCFLVLALVILKRRRPAAVASEALADAVDGEIPEVNFDLSFLHELEPIDVEQTEVGDLHVGNDREWKESNLEEWFRQRAADIARRATERHEARVNRLEGLETHQAGQRQRQLGHHLASLRHDETAAELAQPIDRDRHVVVVHADDADVVAVVADRGGDGALLHAEAGDEAAADIAVACRGAR